MRRHSNSQLSMNRLSAFVGTCFVAVAVLAGCASPSGEAPGGPSSEELVGTWVLDETFSGRVQPFLTIVADGTWTASDGCNGVQGTWTLGDGGALTTTAGPHTLIACDGKPLPTLFADAKKVAVDGETLILKDAAGEVSVTLIVGREQLTPLN